MNTMNIMNTINPPPASVPSPLIPLSPQWPLLRVPISAARLASAALTGQGHMMSLWHWDMLVTPRSSRCVVQESLSRPCYCDKSCTYFRDCCEDYRQFCRKPPVSHWGIAITRNKNWHAPFWVFSGFRLGRKFYLYYHESKYNFARLPGPLSICWPEVHKYEGAWGENSYEWLPLPGY